MQLNAITERISPGNETGVSENRSLLERYSLVGKFVLFEVGLFVVAFALDVLGGPAIEEFDPLNILAGLLGAFGIILGAFGVAVGVIWVVVSVVESIRNRRNAS